MTTHQEAGARDRRDSLPLYLVAAGLLLAGHLARLWLSQVRGFDPDEFEHLHGAWAIWHGMLPYRDYFEHHTPWFHFFLAPFFAFFRVDSRAQDAVAFLHSARVLMWVFSGLILALTFALGRAWRGARVGLVGAVLLAGTRIFLDKTLEIRPDLPSTVLWLGSLWFGLRAIRGAAAGPSDRWRARRLLLWCGVLLGAGVMCTQKLLLTLPGVTLALLWPALRNRKAGPSSLRRLDLLWAAVGFLVPVDLTLLFFASRGSLGVFLESNFLINLRWSAHLNPLLVLGDFVRDSPAVAILAGLGIVWAALKLYGTRFRSIDLYNQASRQEDLLILLSGLAPLAGLFVMPIAWPQYYLTFLPPLSLMGAAVLVEAQDRLLGSRRAAARGWLLAALLAALSVQPARQMAHAFAWSDRLDLAEIRYVQEHTTPAETVLDGWTGRGVFRQHPWYFFFLHAEVTAMLSEEQVRQLVEGLRSGAIAPRLIVFDDHLRYLSPEIEPFLVQQYRPTGVGRIWQRIPR